MFRKNLGGYNENMAPYAGPEALCFQVVRLYVCACVRACRAEASSDRLFVDF